MLYVLLKRVLISTLFLMLTACSTEKHCWRANSINSSASLPCAHLSLPPANRYRNLEVHFQKDDQDIRAYINAYCIPFIRSADGTCPITLHIDGIAHSFNAPLLSGDQRILLPDEAKYLLLNALDEKKVVVIEAGRYRSEVHCEAYAQELQKFCPHK